MKLRVARKIIRTKVGAKLPKKPVGFIEDLEGCMRISVVLSWRNRSEQKQS